MIRTSEKICLFPLMVGICLFLAPMSVVAETTGSPSLGVPLPSTGESGSNGASQLPLDLDRGVVRSLNIEESWVENAFYIHSINADALTKGNNWSLSGELDFAFNSWIGGELDFPLLLLTYPLGSGQASLGPVSFGLRAVSYQTGSEVSRKAAILSVEVEGNLWPTPEIRSFPGQGNSFTPELLWAFRYHRTYFQGITGYTVPVGAGAIANPFFQVSVGRTWEQLWALQLEVDANGAIPITNGQVSSGVTVIPEIAYMPFGDLWLNEIGEGLSTYGNMGPQPTTYFMMEYEFRGI
jgi:hypothetical protein